MDLKITEFQCTSNFSFLKGGSHPEEYVESAHGHGYSGISVCDENTFAGVIRGYFKAKEAGIQYITGLRLVAEKQTDKMPFEVLAFPLNRSSYGEICSLLSKGNLKAEKGECFISAEEILAIQKDIIFILSPPRTLCGPSKDYLQNISEFQKKADFFCKNITDKSLLFLSLSLSYSSQEKRRVEFILQTAKKYSLPLIASNDALYHSYERKALHDVITCIRHHTEVSKAGFLLSQNAERFIKPLKEFKRLFRNFPQALKNNSLIADVCRFKLEELKYEYPTEACDLNMSSHDYLKKLSYEGATQKYGKNLPAKIIELIEKELSFIKELKYEDYFLTCYDIVRHAKSIGILCQGRGAAANSAICFCLGITSVDPARIEVLFERFLSKARNEPPDIDIDFEHERREEVIQYIYNKYGRDRAGLVSNVITYRHRGAVREVGKALGYNIKTIDTVSSLIHRWNDCKVSASEIKEKGIDPDENRFKNWVSISQQLLGFPRHLSQHCGGFVLSERPITHSVPVLNSAMESRTIIEWNKDDIDLLGMLKIDVLALGMLSCIKKALLYINKKEKLNPPLELHSIPPEDPKVYDMLCRADTIGVFQVESRAQMSMLPRLKPRCFYDLVIECAIVRPGPIHGNMVHPYLKRRSGIEKVTYPNKAVEQILSKTLGIPIFQEQAMRLVMVTADFTPDEAEKLRRLIASWKRNEKALNNTFELIKVRMLKNGYQADFINNCLSQMTGFSQYGFPESHAASFALLIYASAWIKNYHPAEFAAALINSQPMGFYAPAQIIRDAQEHGICVKPVDINASEWDCTLENDGSLRLGLRLVYGLHKNQGEILMGLRNLYKTFSCVKELYTLANLSGLKLRKDSLSALARADAFKSLNLNIREALWIIKGLPNESTAFDISFQDNLPELKKMNLQQSIFSDYKHTGLSLKGHPISLLRQRLNQQGIIKTAELKTSNAKSIQKIAGLMICRQRPQTANGTVFITLEDESSIANLIIWGNVYEKFHKIITSATSIIALGQVEKTEAVVHLVVREIINIDNLFQEISHSNMPNKTYSY